MECAWSLVLKQKIAASAPAPCPTSTQHDASFFLLSSKRFHAFLLSKSCIFCSLRFQSHPVLFRRILYLNFSVCFTSATLFKFCQIFSLGRS